MAIYTEQIIFLMVVLFITGLSEGNIVIAQSSIADTVNPNQKSHYFGYINVAVSTAYILGPLIGGKLADPTLSSWFTNATPFVAVFMLLGITFIWILFGMQDTSRARKNVPIHYLGALTNLANVFIDQKRRIYFLINFLIYLAVFGFFRSYPMLLVGHFHMSVSQESEFIAWVSVPIIVANLGLTGLLARHVSTKTIILSTALLTGCFLILIIIPASMHVLWVTLFLAGFSIALCMPATYTLISNLTSGGHQGQVMGNNQSIQVGAEAVSGIVAGMLAGVMIALPLIVFACISFLAGGLLLLKRPSN